MEKNILTSLGPSHQYLQNMYNIMYASLELQIQALMIFNLFHICPVFLYMLTLCKIWKDLHEVFNKGYNHLSIRSIYDISIFERRPMKSQAKGTHKIATYFIEFLR